MKITANSNKWIQFALLSILPFVKAQIASYPRAYGSAVIYDQSIFILGGDPSSTVVPFLNFSKGIDVNYPEWYYFEGHSAKGSGITGFERGVAYTNSKNQIFVQAGETNSALLRNLMTYDPIKDGWSPTQQAGTLNRPVTTALMSATLNPLNDIVYYYGGQPNDGTTSSLLKRPLNTFSAFNTLTLNWVPITPLYPNKYRPGRAAHQANFVNNQLFILGGQTEGENKTTSYVQADFQSVLVYDVNTNTAASVATMGDIPNVRQGFSTVLGLDGKSIVLFGGFNYESDSVTSILNDVYVLDTCTLTWSKKKIGGSGPKGLFGHNAVNINNYMVVTMGKSNIDKTDSTGKIIETFFNEKVYLLDLKKWKWVNSFTTTEHSIAASTCKFNLPSINSTDFVPFNYDYSVLENPLRIKKKIVEKSKGFGAGFGVLLILLIVGGLIYYRRRRRSNLKSRTLNPRWMRNTPAPSNPNGNGTYGDDRDYPLFVYNKELDVENPNNPNVARGNVRTYTASDHEQWEQQLSEQGTNIRHDDIWNRMRGLNTDEVNTNTNTNSNRIL